MYKRYCRRHVDGQRNRDEPREESNRKQKSSDELEGRYGGRSNSGQGNTEPTKESGYSWNSHLEEFLVSVRHEDDAGNNADNPERNLCLTGVSNSLSHLFLCR
jgi:hypothetical protein